MKKQLLTGALFAGTLAAGVIAQADSVEAATVTYDFQFNQFPFVTTAPASFTQDGVTTNVSATGGTLLQTLDGLAVNAPGFTDAPFQVDGSESISFDFGNQLIKAVSATFRRVGTDVVIPFFGNVGGNDDFDIAVDGNSIFGSADIPGGNFFDTGVGTFTFDAATFPAGKVLTFTAPGFDDDYTLSSLSVETIPTPALLPGLLGMGAAALRKRKQEAEA